MGGCSRAQGARTATPVTNASITGERGKLVKRFAIASPGAAVLNHLLEPRPAPKRNIIDPTFLQPFRNKPIVVMAAPAEPPAEHEHTHGYGQGQGDSWIAQKEKPVDRPMRENSKKSGQFITLKIRRRQEGG